MIGQNLFTITFEEENDLERILKGRPWFFLKQFVIFDRLTTLIERSKLCLDRTPIWVKNGLCPLECDLKDLVHVIGLTFGGNALIRTCWRVLLPPCYDGCSKSS